MAQSRSSCASMRGLQPVVAAASWIVSASICRQCSATLTQLCQGWLCEFLRPLGHPVRYGPDDEDLDDVRPLPQGAQARAFGHGLRAVTAGEEGARGRLLAAHPGVR